MTARFVDGFGRATETYPHNPNGSPQGIAAVVPLLEPAAPRAGERAVYLHEIQDPGNLGTILRTADAAGATGRTCDRRAILHRAVFMPARP